MSFDVPPALRRNAKSAEWFRRGPKRAAGERQPYQDATGASGWGNQQQVIKLGQSPDIPSSNIKLGRANAETCCVGWC